MQGGFDLDDLKRNGDKYYDPTAYFALKEYIKSEEKNMELYQGDIFRGELNNGGEREFVILSVHNYYSTVLMLTENESQPYAIKCNELLYCDPGKLQYLNNDKFTTFIRALNKDELDDLMQEVFDSFGYSTLSKPIKQVAAVPKSIIVPAKDTGADKAAIELTKALTERDVYKSLYENLIGSMIVK